MTAEGGSLTPAEAEKLLEAIREHRWEPGRHYVAQAEERIAFLLAQLDAAKQLNADLHFLLEKGARCSFCGERMLTEDASAHMQTCPKHPLAVAQARVKRLEAESKELKRRIRDGEHCSCCAEYDCDCMAALAEETKLKDCDLCAKARERMFWTGGLSMDLPQVQHGARSGRRGRRRWDVSDFCCDGCSTGVHLFDCPKVYKTGHYICPHCFADRQLGHAPDCRLAKCLEGT